MCFQLLELKHEILYTYRNNKNIFIIHNEDDLVELYLELYKKDLTIIGNYTNDACVKLNEIIQEKIVQNNNIKCIDNYFVNQQIVFLESYEDYSTSDFDTISDIKITSYTFKNIDYEVFINNVENTILDTTQIDKFYEKIKNDKDNNSFCKIYNIDDKMLYKYQRLLNYTVGISTTAKKLKTIFKKFNEYEDVKINLITLKKNKIKVLHSSYAKNNFILYTSIKKAINNLNKDINKSNIKIKKFYNDFIIQTLYYILDKYREDVFAQISCAFSCTIHRLQGCSISNIFVNVEDIFKMTEDKNKLKCLYTAVSRCSDKLVVYLPTKPVCKCGIFTKECFDKECNMYICNNKNKTKKCGFMEDKCIDNSNCKKCSNCSKILYNHMFKNDICYLCI